MPLTPAQTILFFAVVFIVFAAIVAVDDLIQARARKRRAARRRRVERMTDYKVSRPLDRTGLAAHTDNVVPLDTYSRKVSA